MRWGGAVALLAVLAVHGVVGQTPSTLLGPEFVRSILGDTTANSTKTTTTEAPTMNATTTTASSTTTASHLESDNSTTTVSSRGRPLASRRRARRNRWRQTAVSVSKSVSSSAALPQEGAAVVRAGADLMTATGPPLNLDASTTRRSLFHTNRQSPPGVAPPSFRPPSVKPPGIIGPPGDIWGDGKNPVFGSGSSLRPPAGSLPMPPSTRPLPPSPPFPQPPAPPVPPPPPSNAFTGMMPSPFSLGFEGDVEVSDIRCVIGRNVESLQAVLVLPPGGEGVVPLLHTRPGIDLLTDLACRLTAEDSLRRSQYRLMVSDLERCGVEECSDGDQRQLCLTVRFPLLAGLQLPEDLLADIRCKPQDPTAEDTQAVSVATSQHSNSDREASLFEGGGQNFQCEIALFQKDSSTGKFTQRVLPGTELELGEEVQLWSIVKGEDGWLYSQLVEVVVHRGGANPEFSSPKDRAELVFSDGCNNPLYQAIARDKPEQSPRNPLLNVFTFRVFLFQDMQPGESLLITAKVIGCVEEEDCKEPTDCNNSGGFNRGNNNRKRREIREATFSTTVPPSTVPPSSVSPSSQSKPPPLPQEPSEKPQTSSPTPPPSRPSPPPPPAGPPKLSPPPGVLHHSSLFNGTTDWTRSLAINVKRPDDHHDHVRKMPLSPPQCQIYLFLTVGVAIAFFLATVVFVITILAKRRKQLRNKLTDPPSPATSSSSVNNREERAGRNQSTHNFSNLVRGGPNQHFSNPSSQPKDSELETSSDTEGEFSWLPQVLVPATVRQRKRQLNSELLDTFQSGTLPLPSCPALLNYYGYMVVPRKAPSSASQGRERTRTKSYSRKSKSPHATLDRHFDPNMIDDMDSDTSSFSEIGQSLNKPAHKERYKRRQRHAERSRSRENASDYSRQQQHQNQRLESNYQIKIDVPPLPPGRPGNRLPRARHNLDENVYEIPVESRPVMV